MPWRARVRALKNTLVALPRAIDRVTNHAHPSRRVPANTSGKATCCSLVTSVQRP